jgi:phage terminase small subunit
MPRLQVSTEVLKARGTYRPARHASRGADLQPTPSVPDPPGWLAPEGLAEWQRLTCDPEYGSAICKTDRAMLAAFCQLWARFVEAEGKGETMPASRISAMVNLASKLGLNPADRTRVRRPAQKPATEDDPWKAFEDQ